MAAPTVVGSAFTTSNTVQTLSVTGCQKGDLAVVVYDGNSDNGSMSCAVVDGAAVAWDSNPLAVDQAATDGTRAARVWSAVCQITSPSGGTCKADITNWGASGTRRMGLIVLRPPAGQKWNATAANRLIRSTNSMTADSGGVWHLNWSATSARVGSEALVVATYGAYTVALTVDANTGSDATYELSNWFNAGNTAQTWHAEYDGSPLKATTQVAFHAGNGNKYCALAVLYATDDPTAASGRATVISKGGGNGRRTRRASGRATVIAKAGGAGYEYAAVKTASGRATVITKAYGWPNRTKTASGRATVITDGFSWGSTTLTRSSGRSNVLTKAGARAKVTRPHPGRSNVLTKAGGAGRRIRYAQGRATVISKGTGPGLVSRFAIARGYVISKAHGVGRVFRRAAGRATVVTKGTGFPQLQQQAAQGRSNVLTKAGGAALSVSGPALRTVTLLAAEADAVLVPARNVVELDADGRP